MDDPIGALSVHLLGGIWGQISVGLFAQNPVPLSSTSGRSGLFYGKSNVKVHLNNYSNDCHPTGGGFYLLGVQTFSVCCLILWGLIATYPILWIVNKITPIRLEPEDEIKGCDLVEHFMGDENEKMLALPILDNVRFGGQQVNFNMIPIITHNRRESLKEFDTLGKRKPFHLNQSFDHENPPQQQSTERL